jgi:hypothetical protein
LRKHRLKHLVSTGACGILAWSIFISAAGFGAQQAEPPSAPRPAKAFPGTDFRYVDTLDRKLDVGQSAIWQITVEQSGGAQAVRLHNSSPTTVDLEGGADQMIALEGAPPWQVSRSLTALRLGQARLSVQPRFVDARREASVLARVLSSDLQRIEASFLESRMHLPAPTSGEAIPAAPILDLLGGTEASLLEVLNYPELIALRDSVQDRFHSARAQLAGTDRAPRRAAFRASAESRVLPAARAVLTGSRHTVSPLQEPSPRGGQTVPRARASLALDGIAKWLSALRRLAETNDLAVDLCIHSSPVDKAAFSLHPKSYSLDPSHLTTDGKLPNVYRGLYVYKVERDGHRGIDCGWTLAGPGRDCGLDLVDDSQPLLVCDLDDGSCQRRAGSPGTCASHVP